MLLLKSATSVKSYCLKVRYRTVCVKRLKQLRSNIKGRYRSEAVDVRLQINWTVFKKPFGKFMSEQSVESNV